MRLNHFSEQKVATMSSQFNSEENQEAVSKELAALYLKDFRSLTNPETQVLGEYLSKFDELQAICLLTDRTADATSRLLQTGCTPAPLLNFAVIKFTRPFRPHTIRSAF